MVPKEPRWPPPAYAAPDEEVTAADEEMAAAAYEDVVAKCIVMQTKRCYYSVDGDCIVCGLKFVPFPKQDETMTGREEYVEVEGDEEYFEVVETEVEESEVQDMTEIELKEGEIEEGEIELEDKAENVYQQLRKDWLKDPKHNRKRTPERGKATRGTKNRGGKKLVQMPRIKECLRKLNRYPK